MNDSSPRASLAARAAVVALCASGFSGLTFEVIWTRWLSLVLGSTTFAVSSVLAAYMAGLGLGAFVLGRWADRSARPLRLYAMLEGGIGVGALLMPFAIRALEPIHREVWQRYEPSFFSFSVLRFALVFVLLALPTLLMGATLPTLSKLASVRGGRGVTVGRLYAVNTAGAVGGAALAGWLLIPGIGAAITNILAASVNLLIAITVGVLSTRVAAAATPDASADGVPVSAFPGRARFLATLVLGLSGAAAMAYEVAWTRMLALVLGPSTYAFSTMLATVLLGLALGAQIGDRLLPRVERPLLTLGLLQAGTAGLVAGGIGLYEYMPFAYLFVAHLLHSASGIAMANKVAMCVLLMIGPTLLLGASFPLAARAAAPDARSRSRDVGILYAVNTGGAVVGAFCGGFLMIPTIGMARTLAVGIIVNLCAAGMLFFLGREPLSRRLKLAAAASLVATAASAATVQGWDRSVVGLGAYRQIAENPGMTMRALAAMAASNRVVFYKEDYESTVSVTTGDEPIEPVVALRVDGKADASDHSDMATQTLLGTIGPLINPGARNGLVIGFGSGTTAGGMLLGPHIERIDAVEMEPSVVEASHFFDHVNGRPLADPRTHLVIADARSYLGLVDRQYDIIASEPSNPWMSGPSHLFTREAFMAERARLSPQGVMVQWLHFYSMADVHVRSILRTLHEVFPHVAVWRVGDTADVIAVGSNAPLNLTPAALSSGFASPALARGLARSGIADPYDFLAQAMLVEGDVDRYAGDAPINRDDDSFIEYGAPKALGRDDLAVPGRIAAAADYTARGSEVADLVRVGLRHAQWRYFDSALRVDEALRKKGAVREADALASLRHRHSIVSPQSFAELAAAGLVELDDNRFDDAAVHLERADGLESDGLVHAGLALALASGGTPERALSLVGTDPDRCALLACLGAGRALRRLGRSAEAIQWLVAGNRIHWADPEFSLERGRIAEAGGDLPGALQWYSTAAQMSGDLAELMTADGAVALNAGRISDARETAIEALKEWPRSWAATRFAFTVACRQRDLEWLGRLSEVAASELPLQPLVQAMRLATARLHGGNTDSVAEMARRRGGDEVLRAAARAGTDPCRLLDGAR